MARIACADRGFLQEAAPTEDQSKGGHVDSTLADEVDECEKLPKK
jgi:hypothetical protein